MKIFITAFLVVLTSCASFAKKPVAPQDASMIEVSTIIQMLKTQNDSMYGYTPYKVGYMKLGKDQNGREYVWSCEMPGMLLFDQENFSRVPNNQKVSFVSNAMLYCKEFSTRKFQPELKI